MFFQKSSKTVILAFCQMNPFDSDIFIHFCDRAISIDNKMINYTAIWEKKSRLSVSGTSVKGEDVIMLKTFLVVDRSYSFLISHSSV